MKVFLLLLAVLLVEESAAKKGNKRSGSVSGSNDGLHGGDSECELPEYEAHWGTMILDSSLAGGGMAIASMGLDASTSTKQYGLNMAQELAGSALGFLGGEMNQAEQNAEEERMDAYIECINDRFDNIELDIETLFDTADAIDGRINELEEENADALITKLKGLRDKIQAFGDYLENSGMNGLQHTCRQQYMFNPSENHKFDGCELNTIKNKQYDFNTVVLHFGNLVADYREFKSNYEFQLGLDDNIKGLEDTMKMRAFEVVSLYADYFQALIDTGALLNYHYGESWGINAMAYFDTLASEVYDEPEMQAMFKGASEEYYKIRYGTKHAAIMGYESNGNVKCDGSGYIMKLHSPINSQNGDGWGLCVAEPFFWGYEKLGCANGLSEYCYNTGKMGGMEEAVAEEAKVGVSDTSECDLPEYTQHWGSTVLDTSLAAGSMAISAVSITVGGPIATYAANFAKELGGAFFGFAGSSITGSSSEEKAMEAYMDCVDQRFEKIEGQIKELYGKYDALELRVKALEDVNGHNALTSFQKITENLNTIQSFIANHVFTERQTECRIQAVKGYNDGCSASELLSLKTKINEGTTQITLLVSDVEEFIGLFGDKTESDGLEGIVYSLNAIAIEWVKVNMDYFQALSEKGAFLNYYNADKWAEKGQEVFEDGAKDSTSPEGIIVKQLFEEQAEFYKNLKIGFEMAQYLGGEKNGMLQCGSTAYNSNWDIKLMATQVTETKASDMWSVCVAKPYFWGYQSMACACCNKHCYNTGKMGGLEAGVGHVQELPQPQPQPALEMSVASAIAEAKTVETSSPGFMNYAGYMFVGVMIGVTATLYIKRQKSPDQMYLMYDSEI